METQLNVSDTLQEQQVCTVDVSVTLPEQQVCAGNVSDTLPEEQVCTSSIAVVANLRKGILPDSLEDARRTIAYLAESARSTIPSMAMLLAYARSQFPSIADWVQWATTCSGLEGDDLHHRRAIGDILLAYRDQTCFKVLFSLDQQKMLALYRIHRKSAAGALRPFLSRYPSIATMTREECRNAVADWLGESRNAPVQLTIPGIDKFFANVTGATDEAIANMVATPAQASSASLTARRLVDAAKAYYGLEGDVQAMIALKAQLAEMLAELDGDIVAVTSSVGT